MNLFNFLFCIKISGTLGTGQVNRVLAEQRYITTGEEKMIKTIILSMCLAASSLSLDARAQDKRQYTEGPVTLVQEIGVEYGHFEEYIDWLNSTWKPTMEATKKAGIIIDYRVFSATPQSPDHPDIILWITYKNMAALDRGIEEEAVAKKVICSTECQNKARVGRNEYRKVLRREYIRELILK
jgi:hypothetical protein